MRSKCDIIRLPTPRNVCNEYLRVLYNEYLFGAMQVTGRLSFRKMYVVVGPRNLRGKTEHQLIIKYSLQIHHNDLKENLCHGYQ